MKKKYQKKKYFILIFKFMKRLAIKGHPTRGKEVIELLEMMGGKNINVTGGDVKGVYFISTEGTIEIHYTYHARPESYAVFALEEFLEKFPYKVGDKVNAPCKGCVKTITSMKWDSYLNTVSYKLDDREFTTINILKVVNELPIIEKESIEEKKKNQMSLANCDLDEVEIVLGDRFELKIKDGKYYAIRKTPKYPTSYEECCKVLGCKADDFFTNFSCNNCDVEISDYEDKVDDLLQIFRKLRYCRDAYWKIAGEQMGLGKPWEPRWNDNCQKKWIINFYQDEINFTNGPNVHFVLAFPTEEMRDAFFESFKKLIEICKELL